MLSESSLKNDIKKALEDGNNMKDEESGVPPMISKKVAKGFATAYDDYAMKAMAGPLLPTTPGPTAMITPFSAPDFAGVGPALMVYWLAVIWAGPGFLPGVTIPIPLVGVAPDIAAMIAGTPPDSADAFAAKFAGILHKYTGMLTVLATTSTPPPTPTTFPVT
jgi:hypothetical protein